MDDNELLDTNDVARILRISRSSVYTLIQRGELPFFQVGGMLRTRRVDVDRYIQNQSIFKRHPSGKKGKKE